MREKKSIREIVETPAKSVVAVLLFFAAMLVCMWGIIVVVRLVLG